MNIEGGKKVSSKKVSSKSLSKSPKSKKLSKKVKGGCGCNQVSMTGGCGCNKGMKGGYNVFYDVPKSIKSNQTGGNAPEGQTGMPLSFYGAEQQEMMGAGAHTTSMDFDNMAIARGGIPENFTQSLVGGAKKSKKVSSKSKKVSSKSKGKGKSKGKSIRGGGDSFVARFINFFGCLGKKGVPLSPEIQIKKFLKLVKFNSKESVSALSQLTRSHILSYDVELYIDRLTTLLTKMLILIELKREFVTVYENAVNNETLDDNQKILLQICNNNFGNLNSFDRFVSSIFSDFVANFKKLYGYGEERINQEMDRLYELFKNNMELFGHIMGPSAKNFEYATETVMKPIIEAKNRMSIEPLKDPKNGFFYGQYIKYHLDNQEKYAINTESQNSDIFNLKHKAYWDDYVNKLKNSLEIFNANGVCLMNFNENPASVNPTSANSAIVLHEGGKVYSIKKKSEKKKSDKKKSDKKKSEKKKSEKKKSDKKKSDKKKSEKKKSDKK